MKPERWLEIRNVFDSILELSDDERRAALEREGARDPELRREVEALLRSHSRSPSDFLASPPFGDEGADGGALSALPQQLGPWRVERRLGWGAMGTVFAATMLEDRPWARAGEEVALKVLHPGLILEAGARERLAREGDIGSRVKHPALVRAHALETVRSEAGTFLVLAQELVVGQTLREVMDELGTVPEPLLRHLALQAARGLHAIHEARVVHRDLKPENLMLTSQHEVKILDLGIARLLDAAAPLTGAQAFIGSSRHAAPEQFERSDVGPAADLYSLGVVLYEAATGVNPFAGDGLRNVMRLHLEKVPALAGTLRSDITPFLEQLLRGLLEKEPAQRFASAEELARVLEEGEASAWWGERAEELRRSQVVRRPRIAHDTEFVGRAAELETLGTAWSEARQGQGSTILIEGEAGVGKSRLVEQLGELIAGSEQPALVLESRFGGTTDALATPLLEQLDASDLEGELARLLPATRPLVPALAAHLRGLPPPADAPPLTHEARQAVYCHLARAWATSRPLLWVLEDMHLATAEELSLMLSLARIAESSRFLLVATTRAGLPGDVLATLDAVPRARRMELERLSREEVLALVAESLESERLGEIVGARVADRTGGNAFFVVEMLRELARTGLADELRAGLASAEQAFATMEVPSTVRAMVEARLEPLPEADRLLLDVASIQGFEFDAELVARMLDRPRLAVLQSIARLERRTRLVRSSGARFAFDHHLLREVLHDALPPALQAEYHDLLADAYVQLHGLDASSPDDLELDHAVVILEHWLLGRTPERGAPLLAGVLEELSTRQVHGSVARLIDLALGRLGGEPRRHGELRLRQADALRKLGRFVEALQAADQAMASAGESEDDGLRARAHVARSRALSVSNLDSAAAEATEALRLTRVEDDWQAWAQAARRMGHILHDRGSWKQSRVWHEQVLALGLARGDRRLEAESLRDLGDLCFHDADFVEAERLLLQSLDRAAPPGLADIRLGALNALGSVLWEADRIEDAERCYLNLIAQAAACGAREAEAGATVNLAYRRSAAGRLAEAREGLLRGRELCRLVGNLDFERCAEGNLAIVAENAGNLGLARQHREAALALSCRWSGSNGSVSGELQGLAFVALWEGRVLEASALHEQSAQHVLEGELALVQQHLEGEVSRFRGELERALELQQRHLEGSRAQNRQGRVVLAAMRVLGLLLELGRREEARQFLLEAEDAARESGDSTWCALASAHRAFMGELDPSSVAIPEPSHALVRVEIHLVLHRAGAGGTHLADARVILERMSRHLSGPALEQFWRNNPTARGVLEEEARA